MTNEHFHELIWDFLYGLLDRPEADNLRAHVEVCPACREALTQAEGQRKMLAQAARVIHEVPAFTQPGQELESEPLEIPAPPATIPASVLTKRRSAVRRYWPVWTAAAALLIVAFGLNDTYRNELARHEAEVAQARQNVQALEAHFTTLTANLENEKRDTIRQVKEQFPPQLLAMGPGQFRLDTPANYSIALRDPTGQLQPGTVTTSVIDPKTNVFLHKQVDTIPGEGMVQVPAFKTEAKAARLVMLAKTKQAEAKIEETIPVNEPIHATHLALDKALYYVGDVLFFRSLTLDRFSLKPPAQALPLRFSLIDAAGRTIKELPGKTGPGGISGGELAVTPDLPGGLYTLSVSAAAGTKTPLMPVHKKLEIVRADTPLIAFDRNQYKPGDKVGINFNGVRQGGNNTANQKVNVFMNVDGKQVPQIQNQAQNQAMPATQTLTDNEGNFKNLQMQLPQEVKNTAEIVVETNDGKKDNRLVQSIPVIPSEKVIDFFPEGGDLVAGVTNRVYYRVRTPQGETVDPEGNVVILAGKQVIHNSGPRRGLGTFAFIPDPAENYAARITGPQDTTEIQNPFQKQGIKSEGLILHVPQSVGKEGEPVILVVRNQGLARRVLLQMTCRDELVDQRCLDLPPGNHTIKLQPAPGTAGILRVTLLDAGANQLIPVAERLLFWEPARHLDVSCEISNGPGPFQAGTNISLKVQAKDEQKNAAPAWLLAAVVDEKYRGTKNEPGLAEHFYLAADFGSDELERANLVLKDTPEARQALDLFLGTQGWRRFVREETSPLLASNANPLKDAAGAGLAAKATFVSLQNTTPQNLQNAYQSALQKELSELVGRANQERAQLIEQRNESIQLWDQAVRAMVDYQQKPGDYLRLALGLLVLGMLLAATILLTLGLVFLLRNKTRPRSYFAGAFSCLLACLFLYLMAGRMPFGGVAHPDSQAFLHHSPWPEFTPDNILAQANMPVTPRQFKAVPASPPLGYFLARNAATSLGKEVSGQRALATTASADEKSDALFPQAQTRGTPQLQNNASTDQLRDRPESVQPNVELQRRYEIASAQAKKPSLPAAAAPMAGGFGGGAPGGAAGPVGGIGGKGKGGKGGGGGAGGKKLNQEELKVNDYYFREYAHRGIQQPGRPDLQDTLLWHPNLFTKDGNAQVSFDLSQNQTTYRILIYANSPEGRLGFYEGNLEVRSGLQK